MEINDFLDSLENDHGGGLLDKKTHDKLINVQKDKIKKMGWITHILPCVDEHQRNNSHTHGLFDNFSHLDLQIVAPLDPQIVIRTFALVIDRIRKGETFKDGQIFTLSDFDVKFINANESNRPVLRIVFPDPEGNIEEVLMLEPFNTQYLE